MSMDYEGTFHDDTTLAMRTMKMKKIMIRTDWKREEIMGDCRVGQDWAKRETNHNDFSEVRGGKKMLRQTWVLLSVTVHIFHVIFTMLIILLSCVGVVDSLRLLQDRWRCWGWFTHRGILTGTVITLIMMVMMVIIVAAMMMMVMLMVAHRHAPNRQNPVLYLCTQIARRSN